MSTKAYATQVRWRPHEKMIPLLPVRAMPERARPSITRQLSGHATAFWLVLTAGVVNVGIGLSALAWDLAG